MSSNNSTGNVGYRSLTDLNAVDIFDRSFYIPGGHAPGVHRYNGMFYLGRHALMLGTTTGSKGRIAVTGNIQRNFSKIGLQRLTTEAISAVATVLARRIMLRIPEMFIDLSLQKSFNSLLVELLEVSLQILPES